MNMLIHVRDFKLLTATAINYVSMISNMLSFLLFSSILLVLSPVATTSAQIQTQGDTCKACNCQFNNVDILTDLIRAEINSAISQRLQANGMYA